MMEIVYSELKVRNLYNCAKRCSATTYQKINSSIVSKDAMNKFKERFLLARIHREGVGVKTLDFFA